jgi:hypothetical protein
MQAMTMTDTELLESIVFNAVARAKQENYEIETQEDDDLAAGTLSLPRMPPVSCTVYCVLCAVCCVLCDCVL